MKIEKVQLIFVIKETLNCSTPQPWQRPIKHSKFYKSIKTRYQFHKF